MIQKNVYRGIEEGNYRSDLDPDLIGRIYVYLVDGIIRRELVSGNGKEFSQLFKEAIHFLLNGMVTEKGKNIFI